MSNKKISLGIFVITILYFSVLVPQTNAFWPFGDFFGKKGDVKAAATTSGVIRRSEINMENLANTFNTINNACKDFNEYVTIATNSARYNQNSAELNMITSSLKLKCLDIKTLSERFRKIYVYEQPQPISTTPAYHPTASLTPTPRKTTPYPTKPWLFNKRITTPPPRD